MKKTYLFLFILFFASVQHISAQLAATTAKTDPTCANNDGTATVTPTGGSNYFYQWSNGQNGATATGLAGGTYTVTVYSGVTATSIVNTTVYAEDFDGTTNADWTLNIPTGTNAADFNYWTINDSAGGTAIGQCVGWLTGDNTLFVTNVVGNDGSGAGYAAATYDAGGCTGSLKCTQTNMAAQSPAINTAGGHNLKLMYDFIANGSGHVDFASVYYSTDGSNYTLLDDNIKSTVFCSTGAPQSYFHSGAKWGQKTYSMPSAINNLSNFRLRFNWTNPENGGGGDPSVAINNIFLVDSFNVPSGNFDSIVKTVVVTAPAGPTINTGAIVVTNPSCNTTNGSITNATTTGGAQPVTLTWKDNVGTTLGTGASLTGLGSGTYTLYAVDNNGCTSTSSFTLSGVFVGQPPVIAVSVTTICPNDSTQLCVPDTFAGYAWNVGGATHCIWVKEAGNYYVTVSDANNCTVESNHQTINAYQTPAVTIQVAGDSLRSSGAVTYQWYLNGTAIQGATDSIYVAHQNGQYTVGITDAHGCTQSSNPSEITNLAISDIGRNINFEIYPNPVSAGSLTLIAANELLGHEVEVFDATGKLIISTKVKDRKMLLNVSQLAGGVYIIRVDGAVRKFTKQ